MDDIAETAGVSKPVLYQHFPSKLELYLALLSESADEMVRLVRAALDATTDNHERVDGVLAAYFTFVADNGGAYRLIFESDLRSQPKVERDRRARRRRLHLGHHRHHHHRHRGRRRACPAARVRAWSGSRRSAPATGCSSRRTSRRRRRSTCCPRSTWRGISRFPRQERPDGGLRGAGAPVSRTGHVERRRQPEKLKPTRRTSAGAIST